MVKMFWYTFLKTVIEQKVAMQLDKNNTKLGGPFLFSKLSSKKSKQHEFFVMYQFVIDRVFSALLDTIFPTFKTPINVVFK
jgi:hypothetical protein